MSTFHSKRSRSNFDQYNDWDLLDNDTDRQRLLEERGFGKPPYEFLDNEIPAKSLTRKRRNISSKKKVAKYPNPNYDNFGTSSYRDTSGVEYELVTDNTNEKKQGLIDVGTIQYIENIQPVEHQDFYAGTQLFWLRIPSRRKRYKNTQPPEVGDEILLYHEKTQIPCTGIVDSLFIPPKGKTGTIIISDFTISGTSIDPEGHQETLRGNGRRG